MSAFHEQFGQLAESVLEVQDAYTRTLELLRNLKDKKIKLTQVVVRDDGWDIVDGN